MSLTATPQNLQPSVQSGSGTAMFETFHQTPHGEFRTSFYNPFEVKHRKRTTRSQFSVLEKAFQENAKPNSAVRKELAQQLNMTPRGVQVWFQNRRAKAKNQGASTQNSSETNGDAGQDNSFLQNTTADSNLFNQHQSLFDPSVALSLNNESLNFSGVGLTSNELQQNPVLSSRRRSFTRYSPLPHTPRTKRCGSLKVVTSESLYDLESSYQQARASKRSYSLDVPSLYLTQDSKSAPASAYPSGSTSPSFLTVTPADDLSTLQDFDQLSTASNGNLLTPTDEHFHQMLLESNLAPPYPSTRRNSCPPEFIASFDSMNFSSPNPQLSTIVEDDGLYVDPRTDLSGEYDMNLKLQDGFPHFMETPVSVNVVDHSQLFPLSGMRAHSTGAALIDPALFRVQKSGRFNNRMCSEPIIHTPFSQELSNQINNNQLDNNQLNVQINNEFSEQAQNFTNAISQASNNSLYQDLDLEHYLDHPLFPATESVKGRTRVPSKTSKIPESLDFLNFDLNPVAISHDHSPSLDDCLDESLYFNA